MEVEEDPSAMMSAGNSTAPESESSSNYTRLSECMAMPVDSKVWSTVCEGVLSVIVGVCGLLGNGATIAVLSRPAFKETFHKLLVSLAVFDSLFIGCAILIYAIREERSFLYSS